VKEDTMAHKDYSEVKNRVHIAFEVLREQKFIARENYWCCQTCAWASLEGVKERMLSQGKPITGYVFYHRQDHDGLKSEGDLYLAFDGEAIDQVEAGKAIEAAMHGVGLLVTWNGSASTRIKVSLKEDMTPKIVTHKVAISQ
jgi:hypothetical protein